MSDPLQEQLLGYVLGALDDVERQQVEESLRNDPRFQRELAQAQASLKVLEGTRGDHAPPPGLLQRTCRLVAENPRPPRRRPMTPVPAAALWSGGTRWPDTLVTAAVLLVSSLLIAPAIQQTRFLTQRNVCQDNLRDLGMSLVDYSQFHQGYFPNVPSEGKLSAAGIFAPTLLREGFLKQSARLMCPGSPRRILHIPSFEELQAAAEPQLRDLRTTMGGTYGYSLGYTDQRGLYHGTKNLGRAHFALVADVPSPDQPARQSLNHAGRGQNVLFEDGQVRFTCSSKPDGLADDIFVNSDGLVAPGLGPDDAVIVPSDTRPLLVRQASSRGRP
jgi:hypothetical protein